MINRAAVILSSFLFLWLSTCYHLSSVVILFSLVDEKRNEWLFSLIDKNEEKAFGEQIVRSDLWQHDRRCWRENFSFSFWSFAHWLFRWFNYRSDFTMSIRPSSAAWRTTFHCWCPSAAFSSWFSSPPPSRALRLVILEHDRNDARRHGRTRDTAVKVVSYTLIETLLEMGFRLERETSIRRWWSFRSIPSAVPCIRAHSTMLVSCISLHHTI